MHLPSLLLPDIITDSMAIVVPAEQVAALWKSAGSDLKFLLDREGVDTDTQSKFYFVGVLTIRQFAAFVDDKKELRDVLKESFELDPKASIPTRVNASRVLTAWTSARARATKAADAEGEADARNVPKDVCAADFHTMRSTFEEKYWEVADRELPGKCYIEKKLDEVEKGDYKAETPSEVVSREEEDPDSLKTVWSVAGELKAVKVSSKVPLPADTEALRHRIVLLGTAWMFVASHQTNRSSLMGLTPQLFQEYLQYLLGDFVLGMILRDGRGYMINSPAWDLLITYEFSIRAKATNLMRKGASLKDALRQSWECPVTKERYFTTPLAIDTVVRRPLPQQPQQQPQLRAQGDQEQPSRKKLKVGSGKGGGKGKNVKAEKVKNTIKDTIKNTGFKGAKETPEGKPLCFGFNSNGCKKTTCLFLHACSGCFKHGVSIKTCPTCSR